MATGECTAGSNGRKLCKFKASMSQEERNAILERVITRCDAICDNHKSSFVSQGVLAKTASALAGIADSPLPVLTAGAKTLHVYSVQSIISGGGLRTFFGCTSTDTATTQVGVELFAGPGGAAINDAAATSLSVSPGATVMFGTGNAAGIVVNSDLGGGSFGNGSARILATSTKLACTAFVADNFNAPPVTTWQLTIIAKLKQKAAN